MMTRWRINGSPTSKQPKTGSGGKCLLLTFGLLALTAGMAFGRPGKISKDLENADPGATVDVIIQFSERPSKQDHQRVFDKRSEEHTSELQSRPHLVCRLLLEKKKHYR